VHPVEWIDKLGCSDGFGAVLNLHLSSPGSGAATRSNLQTLRRNVLLDNIEGSIVQFRAAGCMVGRAGLEPATPEPPDPLKPQEDKGRDDGPSAYGRRLRTLASRRDALSYPTTRGL